MIVKEQGKNIQIYALIDDSIKTQNWQVLIIGVCVLSRG